MNHPPHWDHAFIAEAQAEAVQFYSRRLFRQPSDRDRLAQQRIKCGQALLPTFLQNRVAADGERDRAAHACGHSITESQEFDIEFDGGLMSAEFT